MVNKKQNSYEYAGRLVKGSTLLFTSLVISVIIGFFLRVFLARSLGAEQYGVFYAAFAFVSMFIIFRDFGLETNVVKRIPEFANRKKYGDIKSHITFAMAFQMVTLSIMSASLFILSDNVSIALFGTVGNSIIIKVLSVFIFTSMFSTLHGILISFKNVFVYSLLNVLNMLITMILAIFFISVCAGALGVAIAYSVKSIIFAFLVVIYFFKRYGYIVKSKIKITRNMCKKMFKFSLPVFIAELGWLIISYTDILMITLLRSTVEVGYYAAVLPIAGVLCIIVIAITQVLFPMVSEIWSRGHEKILRNILHFLYKFSLIVIIPMVLVFVVFPDFTISITVGVAYLPGILALQISSIEAIIYLLYAPLVSVVNGVGKPMVNTITVGTMATINVIGNAILIPIYGIGGAAFASFVSLLCGFIILFYYLRRYIRLTFPKLPIFKAAIGGGLSLVFMLVLKRAIVLPLMFELLVSLGAGMLLYLLWVLYMGAITKGDLDLFVKVAPKFKCVVRQIAKLAKKQ